MPNAATATPVMPYGRFSGRPLEHIPTEYLVRTLTHVTPRMDNRMYVHAACMELARRFNSDMDGTVDSLMLQPDTPKE